MIDNIQVSIQLYNYKRKIILILLDSIPRLIRDEHVDTPFLVHPLSKEFSGHLSFSPASKRSLHKDVQIGPVIVKLGTPCSCRFRKCVWYDRSHFPRKWSPQESRLRCLVTKNNVTLRLKKQYMMRITEGKWDDVKKCRLAMTIH